MASSAFYRTNTSPTSAYKWTWSGWLKRSRRSDRQMFFRVINPSNVQYYAYIEFQADDKLHILDYSANGQLDLVSTSLFRDTNAWYHIVVNVDTTQATASDRVNMYVNGQKVTAFDNQTLTVAQNNAITATESGKVAYVGGDHANTLRYFTGSMAHVHFIDGAAYTPSSFGETDTETGVWKANTSPSVTYGNNGFFLKFDNSGSLGNDSSGNSNNMTVANNPTQTLSTPTNNFCTWNYYFGAGNQTAINGLGGQGGTQFSSGSTSNETFVVGNLAFSKGKYYWEWKAISEHPEANFWGVCNIDGAHVGNGSINTQGNSNFWGMNQGTKYNGGSGGSYGSQIDINNIGMCAVDMDNGKIWLGENGTWFGSGDPAAGTNAMYTNLSGYLIAPFHADTYSTYTPTAYYNFGDGYFGTTAVSSAQNPSDGIGIFEYTVPTGFKALCTKSLNAQEYS